MHNTKFSSGFTLIELSIVLVIIGLIAGGVLVGQTLIEQSQLRSITSEATQYKTAVNVFRLKYNALPGDMENASTFWDDASNCGVNDFGDHDYDGVCNGNGDGFVGRSEITTGGFIQYFGLPRENFQFWKHLSKSGLIAGEYSGNSGADHFYRNAVAGVNVPLSEYPAGIWCAGVDAGRTFNTDLRNSLAIGPTLQNTIGVCHTRDGQEGLLTPVQAQGVDVKMDDGKPGTGSIVSVSTLRCTHAGTDANDLDADYVLSGSPFGSTKDDQSCAIAFVRAY